VGLVFIVALPAAQARRECAQIDLPRTLMRCAQSAQVGAEQVTTCENANHAVRRERFHHHQAADVGGHHVIGGLAERVIRVNHDRRPAD
jgi:hypothetical protein